MIVSRLQSRSSNCKAIVGYINGVCAQAVCCGEPTTTKSDLSQSSYCAEHHALHYQPRGSVSEFNRWQRRILIAPSSQDGRRAR
jgi:hypothetical protein